MLRGSLRANFKRKLVKMGNLTSTPMRPTKGLQSDIGEPADLISELEGSWTVLEFVPQHFENSVLSTENDERPPFRSESGEYTVVDLQPEDKQPDDTTPVDTRTQPLGKTRCSAALAYIMQGLQSYYHLQLEYLGKYVFQEEEVSYPSSIHMYQIGEILSIISQELEIDESDESDDDEKEEDDEETKDGNEEDKNEDNSSTKETGEAEPEETNRDLGESSMEQESIEDYEESLIEEESSIPVQAEDNCLNQDLVQPEIRTRTSSLNSRRERRRVAIADVMQRNFDKLVEQIDPNSVSRQLYSINVISENDLDKATNKYVSRTDRAHELAMLIIRKLRSMPDYFEDVCTILKSKGVTVVDKIKAQVLQKCPEGTDNEVEFSIGSFNKSLTQQSTPGPEKMSTLLASVEGYYETNGIKGVKEFIQTEVEKQPCVTVFHDACKRTVNVKTLNILLAESDGYDINVKNKDGRTPLHVACASLRAEDRLSSRSSGTTNMKQSMEEQECVLQQRMKIENLLKHKANCTIQDKDGNTPLHLATIRNDVNAVRLLLNYCTRCINIANVRGNTALHIACREGMEDIVEELCAHKANAAIRNKKRERTPMHLACSCGRIPSAKQLAAYDRSTLDGRDKKKLTPLHITCKHCNTTLISELLQQTKCNPYKIDEQLKTPLHYACFWGNPDLVLPLLKCEHKREFLDAQDKFGDTALHIASRYGHKNIIKLLRDYKANKNIKNSDGKTPAQVAVDCDHDKAAEVLVRKRRLFDLSGKKAAKKLKRSSTVESLPSSISDVSDILFTSDESDLDETL